MKNKLSAVLITLNEEKHLAKCLTSVKDIAGEIVLVDSGSTDKTLEIAKKFEAKIYHRKFDNYAEQKNFAASKASGEWILSVDGDETIEKSLASEILTAIESVEFDGYSIPRKNIILGKFIKHTRWQPELDRHVWLWRATKGNWMGDVHEEMYVKGRIGKLRNAKVHYQYETVREFMEMINSYSEIEAKEKVKNGIKPSVFKLLTAPVYNFAVRYFWRLGFLDGKEGFILSFLMGLYHFLLEAKVWEKTR